MKNSIIKIIKLKEFSQNRGLLSVVEDQTLDINIKRIYFITNVLKSEIRGHHAHFKTIQYLTCLSGSINVMLDDGAHKEEVLLDNPSKLLLVDKLIWHTMEWKTENSVLLVIANSLFDENDYIRNYQLFLKKVGRNEN